MLHFHIETVPQMASINQPVMNTIVVRGDAEVINEEILNLYFTNKKKGGGDVTSIVIKNNEAFITFADPSGVMSVSVCTCILMISIQYIWFKT